ncbi:helix-turn-helix transcriptional regulator [Skermanella mucosa]|uniref:Helix-turn-helix transcriptional regulator n=1 Tax=Skermanella cutis TaxID=2775420 RepID=A0ABX7B2M3_9PROT|nr:MULTISPECIES: helix-turn-helix transcriptional regulator [Skermanella]QQP88589.1 helix-turn-helix transcriptional regulator [Skermanella sp. TT6]UEM02628.1 helix-turn-helix transcriptional regulator [Skermanella rosea]UEM19974.1 helix-turn-helix transcriptional regulator [Skermanella mucosa]
MLKHADIWQAIDRLAAQNGLSASGLARRAGLDPTTFNKSKRTTTEGKLRWPSTESISKVLEATASSFSDFVSLVDNEQITGATQRIPVIGYAQAGAQGFFDDAGYPVGSGWDELQFPHVGDPQAYALEITGDSMEPVYRDGDIIIVSPSASLRRGDRVVVKTTGGEVMAKQLLRSTANRIELQSINPAHPLRTLSPTEITWMARIVWASQ